MLMKKRDKIPALLVGLALILCVSFFGCRLPETAPTTTAESIYIIIEPCLKANVEPGVREQAPLITFKELTLESGTLDRDYIHPDMGLLPHGETCYLLMGTINNGYDEGGWVAYHATGYDDLGNTVSLTLDAGPVVGIAQVYITGQSSEEFTLHMSWSDNVTIFKIRSQASDVMFP